MNNYAVTIPLLIIGVSLLCNLKPDEDKCAEKRSLYYLHLKNGNYREARTFWQEALDVCGGAENMDLKFFKNGKTIYLNLIEKVNPEDQKHRSLTDSVSWIYEMGMQHQPDKIWELDYAKFLVINKYDETEKIDSLFEGHENDTEINDPSYSYYYYQHLIINHYNKPGSDKDKARDLMIEKYFPLYNKCLIGEKEKPEEEQDFKTTRSFLDKYFLMIQTKKMLNTTYNKYFPKLSEHKTLRIAELKHAIELMDEKESDKDTTYAKYVQELLKLEPSAEGYFSLGKIALAQADYQKAMHSFKQAEVLDPANRDEYWYYMALTFYSQKDFFSAFKTAKKIQGDYLGRAFVLCGNCIAAKANDCGESTVERKANFWLANDYYVRAYKLGEAVEQHKFLDLVPTKSDCFDDRIYTGNSVMCNCWNETTIVRFSEND